MMETCTCGKSFIPRKTNKIALDKFCSKECCNKYSWFGRSSWIFGRDDLRVYTGKKLKKTI